jgi:hypothetical protein
VAGIEVDRTRNQILPYFPSSFPQQIFYVPRSRPVRRGVSKGVEDGCRLTSLWAGQPQNGRKDIFGVACLQGVEGMAGPGETLGSP